MRIATVSTTQHKTNSRESLCQRDLPHLAKICSGDGCRCEVYPLPDTNWILDCQSEPCQADRFRLYLRTNQTYPHNTKLGRAEGCNTSVRSKDCNCNTELHDSIDLKGSLLICNARSEAKARSD